MAPSTSRQSRAPPPQDPFGKNRPHRQTHNPTIPADDRATQPSPPLPAAPLGKSRASAEGPAHAPRRPFPARRPPAPQPPGCAPGRPATAPLRPLPGARLSRKGGRASGRAPPAGEGTSPREAAPGQPFCSPRPPVAGRRRRSLRVRRGTAAVGAGLLGAPKKCYRGHGVTKRVTGATRCLPLGKGRGMCSPRAPLQLSAASSAGVNVLRQGNV